MANYKVSLEIEVEANSPLEAALKVNQMLDDHKFDPEAFCWQFYVQAEDSTEIYSVDLEEETEEDAVLPVSDYKQFIN